MMVSWFKELMECLAEETRCYRQLLVLARRQKEILVAAEIQELPSNVRMEEKQVFLLGPLAARRNELLEKIARSLGVKKMDLSGAIEKAPGEVSGAFREAALLLAKTARELEAVNQGNDKLLKNALAYVNFTLRAVATAGRPSAMTRVDRPLERPAASFVNRKV